MNLGPLEKGRANITRSGTVGFLYYKDGLTIFNLSRYCKSGCSNLLEQVSLIVTQRMCKICAESGIASFDQATSELYASYYGQLIGRHPCCSPTCMCTN